MSQELKPCPFCGGEASIQNSNDEFYFASCQECYCCVGEAYDRSAMPEHMFRSDEAAAEAWNRRAPAPAARMDAEREAKEITLLHILNGMGGKTDSSESKWSWLNWFCDDNGQGTDTFNRCEEKGWLHTTHDSDTDCSTTTLTAAGRAALGDGGRADG